MNKGVKMWISSFLKVHAVYTSCHILWSAGPSYLGTNIEVPRVFPVSKLSKEPHITLSQGVYAS